MCVAGVVGNGTLRSSGVAFVASLGVLFARGVRRPAAVGLSVSIAAIFAGTRRISARFTDPRRSKTDAVRLPMGGHGTDRSVLLPAFIWIDGTALVAGLVWLPLVVVGGPSSLAGARLPAQLAAPVALCLRGPVATVAVLWSGSIRDTALSELPTRCRCSCSRDGSGRDPAAGFRAAWHDLLPSVVCLVALAFLGIRFVLLAPDVVGLPREANRDVAEVIARREGPPAKVGDIHAESGKHRVLPRPARDDSRRAAGLSTRVCTGASRAGLLRIQQPFALKEVQVSCLGRSGVEHHRFRQYARGGEMNVWFVPPRSGLASPTGPWSGQGRSRVHGE